MFFKDKTAKQAQAVALALAEYFSADASVAGRWVTINGNDVTVTLPFCAASLHADIAALVSGAWQGGGAPDNVSIRQQIPSFHTQASPVTNVRNIIAVASGKGGVGKSATSVNLAFALQQEGARVGLLDADIYGPSVPIMLGNPDAHPVSSDNKHMQPLEAWGMVANSIGYLVPPEDAAVWRGPMASRALNQLINETLWPVLDYLIVDMPPGTGDIQLTMAQQVPLTGAVVVSTPQDLALADAQKGISLFEKVHVPVLGLIENMSYFQCHHCGEKSYVFSHGGGAGLAERHGLPLLGALPLDTAIREHADTGSPLLVAKPDSPLSDAYREAARAISLQLALTRQPRDTGEAHIRGEQIGVRQS
ncbi:iron-sulfur cluster carrier protein ApbC [Alteromonas sp. CYL-A6]|uniref:iron-sulfur cluster carrier protein ApbC n=1 Tax=Alteromonas nitratireducens TaxID=3390813 RepID=UPI0034AEC1B8